MSRATFIDLTMDSDSDNETDVQAIAQVNMQPTANERPIKLDSVTKRLLEEAATKRAAKPPTLPVVVTHGFGYGNLGNTHNFKVLGDPFAQPRPRFAYRKCKNGSRKGIIYDCEKAKKAKRAIQMQLKDTFPTVVYPGDQPVKFEIMAHLKRPLFHFKNGIRDPENIKECFKYANPSVCQKDVDNMSKFYMDACNKVLYDDDKQVVSLAVTKIYDTTEKCDGRAEILVGEIDLYDEYRREYGHHI